MPKKGANGSGLANSGGTQEERKSLGHSKVGSFLSAVGTRPFGRLLGCMEAEFFSDVFVPMACGQDKIDWLVQMPSQCRESGNRASQQDEQMAKRTKGAALG